MDVADDDTYTAVRIAHGGAQLLGASFHRDLGGKDAYTTYSPRPKNPTARVSAPGSSFERRDRRPDSGERRFLPRRRGTDAYLSSL